MENALLTTSPLPWHCQQERKFNQPRIEKAALGATEAHPLQLGGHVMPDASGDPRLPELSTAGASRALCQKGLPRGRSTPHGLIVARWTCFRGSRKFLPPPHYVHLCLMRLWGGFPLIRQLWAPILICLYFQHLLRPIGKANKYVFRSWSRFSQGCAALGRHKQTLGLCCFIRSLKFGPRDGRLHGSVPSLWCRSAS